MSANHPLPCWVYGLCVLVWPLAYLYGGIDIANCTMSYYPLSVIGACGGTYAIYRLCNYIVKLRKRCNEKYPLIRNWGLYPLLNWCGIHSLAILCMHEFEMFSSFMYSVVRGLSLTYYRPIGIVVAIILAYIIIKLPIMKDIYR